MARFGRDKKENTKAERTELNVLRYRVNEQTEALQRKISDNLRDLNNEKIALNQFLINKESEFADLVNTMEIKLRSLDKNVETGHSLFNELVTFRKDVEVVFTEITHFKDNAEKTLQSIEAVNNTHNELETRIRDTSMKTNLISSLHEQRENDYREAIEEIEKKAEQLKRLVDVAVGASLFTQFEKRRDSIWAESSKWGFYTALSGVFFLCGIGIFYYKGVYSSEIQPMHLLSNFIRTIPLTLPFFYCSSRYAKERNIAEEYAFKASVALTLNEFSNLLNFDDQKRAELIALSTKEVYTPPKGLRDTPRHMSTRQLNAILERIEKGVGNVVGNPHNPKK